MHYHYHSILFSLPVPENSGKTHNSLDYIHYE
jgi:hypothetical protein